MTQLTAKTGVADTYPNPSNAVARAGFGNMWEVVNESTQAAEIALASASTTNIGGQTSTKLQVTGTTTITSFGTTYRGPIFVRFAGALILTHNASTLILPSGANITTAAGDTCIALPISGGWYVATYTRNSGTDATETSKGIVELATPAETITGTDTVRATHPAGVAAAIAAIPVSPAVRQTVLSGAVDSNGFSAFGGSTGSTTVTASATLVATAANGMLNRTGTIVNPSWTGLSTNGTMYLGLTVNADGTCTPYSSTLEFNYQWGGTYSVTSNQRTFNIQEMTTKVGNGASAAQAYDLQVGEVTVAGGVVTAIVWYQLMGRYDSGFTATLPSLSTQTGRNHNIGVKDLDVTFIIECTTSDFDYAVGDRRYGSPGSFDSGNFYPSALNINTRLSLSLTKSGSYYSALKGGGAGGGLTTSSWKYKIQAQRNW